MKITSPGKPKRFTEPNVAGGLREQQFGHTKLAPTALLGLAAPLRYEDGAVCASRLPFRG